jgi:hypothetical protein
MCIDRFLPRGGFMARIADDVIERIKSEVSLMRLAEYKKDIHNLEINN